MRQTAKTSAGLSGVWTIEKFRREDYEAGREPYEVVEKKNTIVTSGLNHFLDRVANLTESNPLNENSEISIQTTTTPYSVVGQAEGYPIHDSFNDLAGSASVVMRWIDDSDDAYTPTTINVFPAGSTPPQFSATAISAGAKDAGDTWQYTWTLTLQRASGSQPLRGAGLDRMLKNLTGANTGNWRAGWTVLKVYNTASGAPAECSGHLGDIAAESVSRTDQTLTWRFVTQSALGFWNCNKIQNIGSVESQPFLREGAFVNAIAAEQTANNERTYDYQFTVSSV